MHIRILLTLILAGFGLMSISAQVKKKINYHELDVIKGLFYQPNTVEPYTGLAFLDYPNENKQMEVQIKNGKPDGRVKEWERNGRKVYDAEFKAGVQVGKEQQWYADGFNKLLVTYQNGLAHGICTEWHQTGGKKSLGEFVQGKEQGEHNWWFATGIKDQTVNYSNGKEEGPMYAWHENGAKKIEAQYKNGKLEGNYALWYSNGQKKAKKTFRDSLHVGEALYWAKDGRLTGRNIYGENGKLEKEYNYNSGSIKVGNNHFAQVFNTKQASYMITMKAEDEIYFVDRAKDITYSMDGMLLQLFTYSNSSTNHDNMQVAFDDFLAKEKKYIEKNTSSIIEINQESKTSKSGTPYYYWQFASPSSKDAEQKARTVQSEHYLTFFCNGQILSLYSVVTNSDEPADVQKMLIKVAETFQCMEEPIDLNAVKKIAK